MNLSHHRSTPLSLLSNSYITSSITIFKVIEPYLRLMNKELEEDYGVEVDLHIAGSAALRALLRSRFNYQEQANTMPVGDVDLFIGIRKIRDHQSNRTLTERGMINRVRGSRPFNNLIHLLGGRSGYSNSNGNGSGGQSGVAHAYQLVPMSLTSPSVIPDFNIIFREGMYNTSMAANIEGLFNSFDLNILECCITLSSSNRSVTRNITTWTDDFEEAVRQGIVSSKRPLEGARLEKYTSYLQHLGIQSDWGLA